MPIMTEKGRKTHPHTLQVDDVKSVLSAVALVGLSMAEEVKLPLSEYQAAVAVVKAFLAVVDDGTP